MTKFLPILLLITFSGSVFSQTEHSVARQWNEALLSAIRKDFARPTVHARNLFHVSGGMYDAWAAYEPSVSTYFLNHTFRNFYCPFQGVDIPENKKAAQEEAISYAAYRILKYRFAASPGRQDSYLLLDQLMDALGYDKNFESIDYRTGIPAALGNYIASKIITFGQYDESNEANNYASKFYKPTNLSASPYDCFSELTDANRWQPLTFITFIDQSGQVSDNTPKFIGPEWGKVVPFSLHEKDLIKRKRDGYEYWVYNDPGSPPLTDLNNPTSSAQYKWNFSLVAIWSAHLNALDPTVWDISPASLGNVSSYPKPGEEINSFYNVLDGGDNSQGYDLNPITGQAYTPQLVKRGDYTRVLAEFWADGPNSDTPPGHWFTILNYVNDHPLFEKRFQGNGAVLDDLEWDVKAYLILGGAMHDAALTAWGIKGYYDYVRPFTAIRYMSKLGQSSDSNLPYYHPNGMPLVPGYIELIGDNDPLAETFPASFSRIKIKAWNPYAIDNPDTDEAGVDWLVGCQWWPYQRPTFVTPPFAGYISGHSTFSRTAAEVLSLLTGSEYFPGGLGEFHARKNEFLVFEEGPSEDIVLQWAKYKDASDQCSLSRIWGGIHPPADDMPGRLIGMKLGPQAFEHALKYFNGSIPNDEQGAPTSVVAFPNPIHNEDFITLQFDGVFNSARIIVSNANGHIVFERHQDMSDNIIRIPVASLSPGMYVVNVQSNKGRFNKKLVKY